MMPKIDLPLSQFCNDTHYDWRLFYDTNSKKLFMKYK